MCFWRSHSTPIRWVVVVKIVRSRRLIVVVVPLVPTQKVVSFVVDSSSQQLPPLTQMCVRNKTLNTSLKKVSFLGKKSLCESAKSIAIRALRRRRKRRRRERGRERRTRRIRRRSDDDGSDGGRLVADDFDFDDDDDDDACCCVSTKAMCTNGTDDDVDDPFY